jgi:hypothetical protein
MWIFILIILLLFLGLIYYFSNRKENRGILTSRGLVQEKVVEHQKLKVESYQDFITNNREILEEKVLSIEDQIKGHTKLYKKYLAGIDESFDQQGNLIQGVPPDIPKAIFHMQQAILLGFNEGFLEIARILHRGAHNFQPDTQNALEYYQKYHEHPFANTAGKIEAQLAINEINGQRRPIFNRNQERNRPPERRRLPERRRRNADPGIPVNLVEFAIRRIIDIGDFREAREAEDPINVRRNDTQNVHEHAVNKQLQLNITDLYKQVKPNINVLPEIRNYITRKGKGDRRDLAIQILDDIERNEQVFEYYENLTLAEILSMVWIRIKQLKESENAKEMLLNNLVDCIQHGYPVCATGKIARIVDTLTIFDESLMKSKPTWMIKEEIHAKVANIRDTEYNKLSATAKKEVDALNTNAIQEKFTEDVLNEIDEYVRETYLDKEIILETEYEKIMDEIKQGLN